MYARYVQASVQRQIGMRFICRCGFSAQVAVDCSGGANGLTASRQLSQRALDNALRNAEVRLTLCPCPACGVRRFDVWRSAWLSMALKCLGVCVFLGGPILWASNPRHFERHPEWFLYFNLGLQLFVAAVMLREISVAKSKVHFEQAATPVAA